MQAESAFVGDGYDEIRYIRRRPRLHPEVRLTVRIVTPTERAKWAAEHDQAADEGRTAVTTRYLAAHIVGWSLPVKPTAENVARLVPALYDRLFRVVFGDDGGDPLPETGETPENDPEGDAKNSPTG